MIFAYVCLQYRALTPEALQANKRAAREIAKRINAIPGWRAVVPHNLSEGIESSLTEDEWLEFDIELMKRSCDVLVWHVELSNSDGCMKERRRFEGAKVCESELEEVAAEIAARQVRRALHRGRC